LYFSDLILNIFGYNIVSNQLVLLESKRRKLWHVVGILGRKVKAVELSMLQRKLGELVSVSTGKRDIVKATSQDQSATAECAVAKKYYNIKQKNLAC
jgi:hypothetical protein